MGDGKALAKAPVDEQIAAFERAFDEAVAVMGLNRWFGAEDAR